MLNIFVTIAVGLIFWGRLIGVGVGTVIAVVAVGRVIALFNHFCLKKMTELAQIQAGTIA